MPRPDQPDCRAGSNAAEARRTEHPIYVVTLQPAGGTWAEIPADVRLRRLLKCAGRSFGLRCLGIFRQPEPAPVSEERAA